MESLIKPTEIMSSILTRLTGVDQSVVENGTSIPYATQLVESALRMELHNFTSSSRPPAFEMQDEDLPTYWMRHIRDETCAFMSVANLAMIILGVPHSSIKLERDFRHLKLVLSELRMKLGDDTLDDILVSKLNFHYLQELNLPTDFLDILHSGSEL